MSLLYPTVMVKRVADIEIDLLRRHGIKALLLDVDNTLATHNHPDPQGQVLGWMDTMRANGIKLMLVSNNRGRRVEPFAKRLSVSYTANAAKPLTLGFRKSAKKLGMKPEETAVVGDQLFTDILGGNLFGAMTILVEPMEPEDGPFFRFKRKQEKRVMRRYAVKKGKC